MAVSYLNNNTQSLYSGLSTDTKPKDVQNGSIFIEIDTSMIYMYDRENDVWHLQTI